MKKLLLSLPVSLLLLISNQLFAQKITGTVTGDGTAQQSVSITAQPSGKGVVSDKDGNYSLGLTAGKYVITFSETGFKLLLKLLPLQQVKKKY